MDTSSETSNALDVHQAAPELAKLLDPQPEAKPEDKDAEAPAQAREEPEAKTDEPEAAEAQPEDVDETITIEVDGKPVELKKSELADYYKNGLRQSDYTKKTMAAAETVKAAEAERAKALQERQQLATGLQQAQSLLQAQLHEQSQIDWQKLLDADPQEYLKQRHLVEARQAQLSRVQQEQQQLYARHQAEQAEAFKSFVQTQQQELLAKLPEWKDEAKGKAEREQIKDYLKSQGLDDAQIGNITDHRVVLIARDAMRFQQITQKAQAASKKVANLPQKVERSGGGEANALDGRSAAMKQLGKSGRVEDAARVLASIL